MQSARRGFYYNAAADSKPAVEEPGDPILIIHRLKILFEPDLDRAVFGTHIQIGVVEDEVVRAVGGTVTAGADRQRVSEHARHVSRSRDHAEGIAARVETEIRSDCAVLHFGRTAEAIPEHE